MTEDPGSNHSIHHKSWLERLSHVLLREPQDKQQLIEILKDAEQRNLLDANALSMIEGVLQVSQMQVRDIMIPRSQMVVVEIDDPPQEFLPRITQSGHSRFPVITESRDEIIGLLLAKDLLSYDFTCEEKNKQFSLKELLRPCVFIPESKRLDVLLKEFRLNHKHMAIVIDEYGGVSGLITIEDVLEQIVGDIEDEYDTDEDENIKRQKEKLYIVKALTPIEEFNEFFHTSLSDEEFDTIGGLVMGNLGHLPKRGETVTIDSFQFKVVLSDNRRVRLLEALVL